MRGDEDEEDEDEEDEEEVRVTVLEETWAAAIPSSNREAQVTIIIITMVIILAQTVLLSTGLEIFLVTLDTQEQVESQFFVTVIQNCWSYLDRSSPPRF